MLRSVFRWSEPEYDLEGKKMLRWRIGLLVFVAVLHSEFLAAQFVLFPETAELVSPNRRLVVHNVSRENPASDLVGTFQSLWLTDFPSGRSRKLCDYVGVAAVAWAGNEFVLVTEYLNKKTSRALVFSATDPDQAWTIDKPTLLRLLPVELRPTLRENDHVFIEASRMDANALQLTVWGNGQHDANGFRWRCQYALREGTIGCADAHTARQQP
jgi:hypothetical protein